MKQPNAAGYKILCYIYGKKWNNPLKYYKKAFKVSFKCIIA